MCARAFVCLCARAFVCERVCVRLLVFVCVSTCMFTVIVYYVRMRVCAFVFLFRVQLNEFLNNFVKDVSARIPTRVFHGRPSQLYCCKHPPIHPLTARSFNLRPGVHLKT